MIRRKEPEKEICVVVARPGDAPISIVIENTLKNFQDLVTGQIETFPFWGYVGVCNEEGIFNGMPINRRVKVGRYFVLGPVVITKASGDGFVSLSGDEVKEVMSRLEEWPV